jgi:catechol 2,3-dioxygenase-like lactoylglutathione lyase family enzyme
VDDIHAEFNRLRALGVQFKSQAPNHITEGVNKGGYTIYFYGPDGVTLEFMQPPPG